MLAFFVSACRKEYQVSAGSHKLAVIGGGIAGSTIALNLAELGIEVHLLEAGPSLVNGPPACHLHAGGNLYRELDTQQCIDLLEQSLEMLSAFPHCANPRPTVLALPLEDASTPQALLPRLEHLRSHYQQLIEQRPELELIGKPEHYFSLYSREQLQALAERTPPAQPRCDDDWMIPLARQLDLNKLQFPLILVQEYGLSMLRLAASCELMAEHLPNLNLSLNSRVDALSRQGDKWQLTVTRGGEQQMLEVDYLVNACGFRTGSIDDQAGLSRQRMVEFKAAFLSHWPRPEGHWPEVIIHGERGTPQGMAQLTPYADSYFQLHGMTEEITLFKDGLVASDQQSAQPRLPSPLLSKIEQGWPEDVLNQRSELAIAHFARFLPDFSQAEPASKALFGAQQIPGGDPSRREATVSFADNHYARAEIVKFSSAPKAARLIAGELAELGWSVKPYQLLQSAKHLNKQQILSQARAIATARQLPPALAEIYGEFQA